MKKFTLLFVGILLFPFFSNAGGIVTNTNQSAAWVRMFARDASTGIDAVYFNPAGLAKLDDGFYISLNDQIITQNRYISSDYQFLNTSDYEGSVFAPIFPSIYLAFKKGRFAISFGANVIGGGGSATFEKGLPLFDMAASDLVPKFASQGVTGYSLDAYLEGSSVFWGYQLGVTYAINDMISVYLGARYVSAKNTYVGHLNDITLYAGSTAIPAETFMDGVALQLSGAATQLQPLIDGGGGELTINQAYGAGYIDLATKTQLEGTLSSLGLSNDQISAISINGTQTTFNSASVQTSLAADLLVDQEGDIEQKGSGIAPIIGVNLSLMESKLNIGMKYEFETNIELENDVAPNKGFAIGIDNLGQTVYMYNDGDKVNSDMPAMIAIGADYKLTEKFSVAVGGHYYFDKQADYGKQINGEYVENDQVINKGLWEAAIGLEYKFSDKFLLSLGYLHTQIGVKEVYQSNLSYTNSSNSIGFGGAYKVTPGIELNLGVGYTTYETFEKNSEHNFASSGVMYPVIESYDKDNLFVALGLDFKLFGKK